MVSFYPSSLLLTISFSSFVNYEHMAVLVILVIREFCSLYTKHV